MMIFLPGGYMGVWLYSNAPFNWDSTDNIGFIQDLRRRSKVFVACGSMRHQICMGKLGSTPLSPDRKWHF